MQYRKKLTTLLLSLCTLSMLARSEAMAEKRPLSKKELEDTATHIVVGKVQAIYSRKEREGNYEYTRFLAEVSIDKREKGEGPDDLIYVRYFSISWKGPGQMPPGPSGHYPLPKHGSTYRFYLSRNAYDGYSRDGTKDGGFNVVYGNGAQLAESPNRTAADETKPGPRETFVKYFQAMDVREHDVANALKVSECTDNLNMNIHSLDILDRLQPFYELSTPNQALVVAHPFTISSKVLDREEVIYAQLAKQNGAWRIQKLARISPENASSLMKGFQIHSDVKLNLSTEALVGKWWYPCDSTIVLNADGTGSDLEVVLGGSNPDQKFTWTVNGSTLIRRFANREEQLVVTSIDHEGVRFVTPDKTHHSGWRRRVPVTVIADAIVEARLRSAIMKPTGELTQEDLEKELWRLDFRFAPITDEGLREVAKIKQVKDLLFNRTARITDAGLKEVAKLKHLEGLSLMQTQITDAGLREIATLRKIEGLNLQNTKVTSAGLTELLKAWNQPGEAGGEGASKLRYLLLDNCPGIDDVALKEISQHRHLEGLQLGGTAVTDAGLKELADHKQLTSLSLGGTQITDEGLKEVAKLQQLTSLSVGGPQITDAGLKQIVRLKNLQRLSLGGKVTDAGLGFLEKALPNCSIRYNGKVPSVGAKDLDDFEAKLKADPQYLMRLLAEDRDRGEALLRAGQKQRPTARPWAMDIQMLFAGDVFTGKSLQGEEKVALFKHALEYLQESYDIALQTLDKSHGDELQAALPGLQIDLALAALEAGQVDSAKKHAAETLRNNTDRQNWNYGNIIHNANQILGRCALREGKLADAKTYLLKAGATPGSPQLNSFGPQMQLARELLERGEKETVLQYLDLVARFWANPEERTEANSKRTAREHLNQLEAWKKQLRAGKVPDHKNWK